MVVLLVLFDAFLAHDALFSTLETLSFEGPGLFKGVNVEPCRRFKSSDRQMAMKFALVVKYVNSMAQEILKVYQALRISKENGFVSRQSVSLRMLKA